VIVSNESRELNAFRSKKFGLDKCRTASYLQLRSNAQARRGNFQLALDLAQVQPENAIFIDNTRCLFKSLRALEFTASFIQTANLHARSCPVSA